MRLCELIWVCTVCVSHFQRLHFLRIKIIAIGINYFKCALFLPDCGPHKEISNGKVSGDTLIGGTPVISCDPGYSQTGTAKCKGLLTWETDVKCQKGEYAVMIIGLFSVL